MAKKYDAIVVGIGSTGASTCFQLARRGMKVLGLEKSSIPNAEASHHGHSRLIRLAGLTRTDDIPLLRRAYENWDDLQRLCGQKILHRTGGIYLGAPDSRLIVDARRSIVEYGVDCEELSQQQVVDRFPMFRPAEHWVGLIEPDAGLLVPELAVSAFADRALRYGAELRGHSPVMDWEVNGQGVCVKTDRKKYEADKLVFCGGAWSGQLLGDLGLNIRVSRQVLAWLWPRRPELFAYGRFPVWVLQPDGPPGTCYGFPMMPDRPGFKVALQDPGPPADPNAFARQVQRGEEDIYRPALKAHIPDANGSLLSLQACLYAETPDGHFIVDRHPHHERVCVGCGFSGHGFKFASVVGEALADLCQHGRSDLPINAMSLRRFVNAA